MLKYLEIISIRLAMTAALYLFTVLIWGSSWFAITFQISEVDPFLSLFYRFALAAVLMIALCKIRGVTLSYKLKDHGLFLLLGLFLFSGNYVLFYFATYHVVTGLISLIFSLILVFNTLLSWLVFNQKPDKLLVIGGVLGLCGIVMIFYQDITASNLDHELVLGILLSLVGAFLASCGNITSRHLQNKKIPVLSANCWGMIYSATVLAVIASFISPDWTFPIKTSFIVSLLYLSLFATVLGFWSYLTLVGRLGPARAAYTTILFPVVALTISTFFEDLQWTELKVAGVVLTLLGNLLILPKSPLAKWLSK